MWFPYTCLCRPRQGRLGVPPKWFEAMERITAAELVGWAVGIALMPLPGLVLRALVVLGGTEVPVEALTRQRGGQWE